MPMTVDSGLSCASCVAACCHRAPTEVPREGRTTRTRASSVGVSGAARTDAVSSMDVTLSVGGSVEGQQVDLLRPGLVDGGQDVPADVLGLAEVGLGGEEV